MHCCHCGIRFLTHPRNANRRNLYCPFGCREHRRRQHANSRSKKHYQTEQGRRKKKLLNGKRSEAVSDTDTLGETVQHETGPEDASSIETATAEVKAQASRPDPTQQPTPVDLEIPENLKLSLDGFTLDEATLAKSPLLPYLAMITSLIEGHAIRADELLNLLLRSMRQRSFDRLPRREYVLRFLKQHPP